MELKIYHFKNAKKPKNKNYYDNYGSENFFFLEDVNSKNNYEIPTIITGVI